MLNKLTGFTGVVAGGLAFALVMLATVKLTPTDHWLRWVGLAVAFSAFAFLAFKGANNKRSA
jgi:multisubunit Na+/H+ antiporter MnhB subunit